MICKHLKTGKYFNYSFIYGSTNVEINDKIGKKYIVSYKDWSKNYLIIDKWRNLNEWDIKQNKEIDKKIYYEKFSSS